MARIVDNVAFVGLALMGFFLLVYGFAGDDDTNKLWGVAFLGWAKAFEVSLRLRDHQDGKDG